MTAYYSEFENYPAEWMRNLIRDGHIAPGVVDERDLWDVAPSDLIGHTQIHLCAGIGGWSHALRLAEFPDDRHIWTVSCPCQPFSAAGKGLGFADERHLWPAVYHLIRSQRPCLVVGEQVASRDGRMWLDLVQTDMEAAGYAFWAVVLPVASIGAPGERHRILWLAYANDAERRSDPSARNDGSGTRCRDGEEGQSSGFVPRGALVGLGDTAHGGYDGTGTIGHRRSESADRRASRGTDASDGFWSSPDWLYCTDGKWRPVEAGTRPLSYGLPRSMGALGAGASGLALVAGCDAGSLKRARSYRVGTLRGYGNAINPVLVAAWIRTWMNDIV